MEKKKIGKEKKSEIARMVVFFFHLQFEVGIKADKIARKQTLDPAVHKECPDNSVKTVMEVCVKSLSEDPNDRPSIEDVLWNLHFAAQVQDLWQGDSPSRKSSSPVFTSQ